MLDRARLALEHGRLAVAEESIAPLLADRGEIGVQAARLADQVDLYTGRRREIVRRIERRWSRAKVSDQPGLLRLLWQLDSQPVAILPVSEALERMVKQSPEDDRVLLGLAELARGRGDYDPAGALLDRCEATRPNDPDVLRARLSWAIDASKPHEAIRVAAKLPANEFSAAEVAGICARMAAMQLGEDKRRVERLLLERRVELEPGDTAAWDRLAELATAAGLPDLAAQCRRRKAEMTAATDRYRMLMAGSAAGNAVDEFELARAAEALSRRFEARGWWTLGARKDPDNHEARTALERLVHVAEAPAGAGMLIQRIPEAVRPEFVSSITVSPKAANLSFRDKAQEYLCGARGNAQSSVDSTAVSAAGSPVPQQGERHVRGCHRSQRAFPVRRRLRPWRGRGRL
jgi:tetratricopeptide (TPR) repeat protein